MAEEENVEVTPQATPSAKKPRKKGPIVAIVIVVVILVAGCGFWAWHNTPGFCGDACHNTMGEHLANYNSTDASEGAGLASVHAAANVTCLDCHEATIEAQTTELSEQLSGDYDMDDLALSAGFYVDNDKCLACHEGSWEALAEKTADLGDYNPHDSIHGTIQYCNECHKGHSEQVDTCGQCHPNGGQEMIN